MKIILVITGGIAAVKIYDFIRMMQKKGHIIIPVMTKNAGEFVTKTALGALTASVIYDDLFVSDHDYMEHIHVSRGADMVLVAPATANFIAKTALGLADDFASTMMLAADIPIIIAPAMNPKMWEKPILQAHIKTLEGQGITILMPQKGEMACGETGQGRMMEPDNMLEVIENMVTINKDIPDLTGKKILITAGATIEKIDPVRYISNFSSGKQAHGLAKIALLAGAEVHYLRGSTQGRDPIGAHIHTGLSAQNMYDAAMDLLSAHKFDMAICAAAICDWRPEYHDTKQKKQSGQDNISINMTKNPDILNAISHHAYRPEIVAGFAAETDNIMQNAQNKLSKKGCDYIFLNDVSKDVFGAADNHIIAFGRDGLSHDFGSQSKIETAKSIFNHIYQ